MNRNNTYTFSMLLLGGVLFFCTPAPAQQDHSLAIARADTTNFRINKKEGWVLYNSYMSKGANDSISFEVIIQHDKGNDNWSVEQYFGKIKNPNLLPAKEQKIVYYLLKDSYAIRIEPDGKCFIRLRDGSLPKADPVVIPIQVKYVSQ